MLLRVVEELAVEVVLGQEMPEAEVGAAPLVERGRARVAPG